MHFYLNYNLIIHPFALSLSLFLFRYIILNVSKIIIIYFVGNKLCIHKIYGINHLINRISDEKNK